MSVARKSDVDLMTTGDAVQYLKLSMTQVQRLVHTGVIPVWQRLPNGTKLLRREDVEAFGAAYTANPPKKGRPSKGELDHRLPLRSDRRRPKTP